MERTRSRSRSRTETNGKFEASLETKTFLGWDFPQDPREGPREDEVLGLPNEDGREPVECRKRSEAWGY
ncbi:hypothetical protein E2C01_080938 [Portunus trituberculatus]|uniref:Uncharacterized protein n=1 Tax=Portunus trituberculatus TaxID=210409 RepID=A0A5B7IQN6_PORTR|nr:hypothetical protein [Portunus trituberculatus]